MSIDNVARELVPKIRAALGVRQYMQVLYREYLGSNLTEPAYGPVEFELTSVQMTGTTLSGTVVVKNLQNRRFPRITRNYGYQHFSEPATVIRTELIRTEFLAPLIGSWRYSSNQGVRPSWRLIAQPRSQRSTLLRPMPRPRGSA